MKHSLNLFLLLFVPYFVYSNHPGYKNFENLENALEHPDEVVRLKLSTEHTMLNSFLIETGSFTQLKEVFISNADRSKDVDQLILFLSKIESLERIALSLSSLKELPKNIDGIKQLRHIDLYLPVDTKIVGYKHQMVKLDNFNAWIGTRPVEMNIFSNRRSWDEDAMSAVYNVYPDAVIEVSTVKIIIPDTSIAMKIPAQSIRENSWLKYDKFSVQSDQAYQLNGYEGFKLTIPENAFVDANGRAVTGDVEVYASMVDSPLEMAFGGIPMNFDSPTESGFMESDGMIDIRAKANGQFLELAPGKTMTLELPSMGINGDFNTYTFDDNGGAWNQTGVAPTVAANTGSVYSEAYRYYIQNVSGMRRDDILHDEINNLASQFSSTDYIYTDHRTTTIWKDFELTDPDDRKEVKKRFKRKIRHSKVHAYVKVVRTSKAPRGIRNRKWFELNFSRKHFPELGHFGQMIWKMEKPMSNDAFKKLKRNAYCDFRMGMDEKGEVFELYFKDVTGKIDTISAVPYVNKNGVYEMSDVRSYSSYYSKYKLKLKDRGTRLANRDLRMIKKTIRTKNRESERLMASRMKTWDKSRELMNTNEINMVYEEWDAYARDLKAQEVNFMLKKGDFYMATNRILTLNGMGLMNVDRIREARGFKQRILAMNEENGREFKAVATYTIIPGINSAFNLISNSFLGREGKTIQVISFNKNGEAVFMDSSVFYGEKFNKKEIERTIVVKKADEDFFNEISSMLE